MTTPAPPFDPATLTDDPEIAALLDFEPVVRKCLRADGWWPEHQYRFILGVAETGDPDKVAHALGQRTFSGAWKLRKAGGGEGFARAWDGAKALYLKRNPPVRRPLAAAAVRPGRGGAARARADSVPLTPEQEARQAGDFFKALMKLYWTKVKAERRCRLEGRIVAADLYVRQMMCIELAADLSAHGQQFLAELKRGEVGFFDAVATPLSFCFDYLRRRHWAESGDPDRPELPFFFREKDGVALGPTGYNRARTGLGWAEWCRREDLDAATAAEGQRLWEEKSRSDAALWRARLEREEPDKLAAILAVPELELAPDHAAELAERDRADISSGAFAEESPALDPPQPEATAGGGATSNARPEDARS